MVWNRNKVNVGSWQWYSMEISFEMRFKASVLIFRVLACCDVNGNGLQKKMRTHYASSLLNVIYGSCKINKYHLLKMYTDSLCIENFIEFFYYSWNNEKDFEIEKKTFLYQTLFVYQTKWVWNHTFASNNCWDRIYGVCLFLNYWKCSVCHVEY